MTCHLHISSILPFDLFQCAIIILTILFEHGNGFTIEIVMQKQFPSKTIRIPNDVIINWVVTT